MSASWYDVLGVEPDATADEIRAVWKAAIADLDPTDRRFRACNQAAEVLLDPVRRAAHDAELAADVEPAVDAEPDVDAEPAVEAEEEQVPPPPPAFAETAPARRPVVPGWLLVALAVSVSVITTAAAVVWFTVTPPEDVEAKITEAKAQAESAMPTLYSYDWKTAETDRDQALRLTTGQFRQDLQRVWDEVILPNVDKVKGHAEAETVTSGVVRSSDDGDNVEILVILDSQSGNVAGTNKIRLAFTVTMTEVAGHWLISDVEGSNPAAGGQSSSTSTSSPSAEPSQSPTG